jgi:hypothetical protein
MSSTGVQPLVIEDLQLANNREKFVTIFEQTFNASVAEAFSPIRAQDSVSSPRSSESKIQASPSSSFERRVIEVIDGDSFGRKKAFSVDFVESCLERSRPQRLTPRSIISTESASSGRHLIILLHGFQGSSWDMRTFKNHMAIIFPNSVYLTPTCNEGLTEGDIGAMGSRVADEIDKFIQSSFPYLDDLARISVVAHSLGGVIFRTAMKDESLNKYKHKFYTFFSLGSPHCGFIYNPSVLLNTGIWVLRKWSKSTCLDQLSLCDDPDPERTFLFKLSQTPCLEYFVNVLLVASPADKYAPYHSARIEMNEQASKDKKLGSYYSKMVHNLLEPLGRKVNFTRFDVCFLDSKFNLDKFIGRASHIYFLDQPLYILMFLVVYKNYFA